MMILSGWPVLDLLSLALTSRYLNAFARNDYVWKRLFFEHRNRSSTRIVFRGNWFLTYLYPTPEYDEACLNHPLVKHPLPIQGVTSSYLSQQWHRGRLFLGHFYPPPALPPTPTTKGHHSSHRTFALENYDDLDIETFNRRYRYPNRPLMIQNSGVEQWPAWEQWTLEALSARYGEMPFRVSNIESDTEPSFNMCFQDFLHYIRYNNDTDPLYLFDPYFADNVPEMDIAYKIPKYFEFDFFSLLKDDIRPPYRWILVGPQRTGAPWHVDPSGTSAWNTLLSGHKRWALYPPHTIPPGHDPMSPVRKTSVSWYLDVYPHLPPESLPLEIVQNPGQTIYVPSGWWHMVINMDDTVAVTHNFADEANLLSVKRSLLSDERETTQVFTEYDHTLKFFHDNHCNHPTSHDPNRRSVLCVFYPLNSFVTTIMEQLKRWEMLEKEISLRRPDFAPALTFRPEELLLPGLLDRGPWLDIKSSDSLTFWRNRALQILQRVDVVSELDTLEPVLSGRNICFLTENAFVKFFTPYQDGLSCYHSEVAANQILIDNSQNSTHEPVLSSPKMLGYGYWSESKEAEGEELEWQWPYIITDTVSAMPLLEAVDFLPQQQVNETFLVALMGGLQYYHTLPLTSHQLSPKLLHLSNTTLPQRLHATLLNHARWRLFPAHLLDQLASYLPTDSRQVFDPYPRSQGGRGDILASLVHGDVSPSNILGTFSTLTDLSTMDPSCFSSPFLLPHENAPPPDFKPTTMIDYGDTILKSDPLIDFVSVFITILNSRRDPSMIEILLESWRQLVQKSISVPELDPQQLQQNDMTTAVSVSLARRCMWHTLMWPSEGLTLHLTQCVPEIGEMNTWLEVEEALFGWWSSV
ncbi:hypothetical protein FBU30_005945 [Linnemannia zychae]|nr:hypothetical protein FBU30_005945 [Linnemannia zychae]